MGLSYDDAFRTADLLNPVSTMTLLQAGKLAGLTAGKSVLELGCGKGLPSLLWAESFGAHVVGIDLSRPFVDFARARAEELGLSER